MAYHYLYAYYGSSPNYHSRLQNLPSSGVSWSTIKNAATANGAGGTTLLTGITIDNTTDKWYNLALLDFCFDVREYSFLLPNITAAWVGFSSASITQYRDGANLWPTAAQRGLTIIKQRRSIRSSARQITNFPEIVYGAENYTELATRQADSSLPTSGTEFWFPFNSTGVSHIQGLNSESDLPGYFVGSCIWGGIVDGVAPTWGALGGWSYWDNPTSGWVSLCVETPGAGSSVVGVHHGPAGNREVIGGQIQVSGSWRDITEIKVQHGGIWKDVV